MAETSKPWGPRNEGVLGLFPGLLTGGQQEWKALLTPCNGHLTLASAVASTGSCYQEKTSSSQEKQTEAIYPDPGSPELHSKILIPKCKSH